LHRKRFNVEWVKGPVGVQSRNFSNARIYATGWQARFPLIERIERTVAWIEAQVKADVTRQEWDVNDCLLASLPGDVRRQT